MTERLSRERIEEIAARAEAATEGPWEVGGGGGAHMDGTRDWYTVDCPWNERTKYRIGLAAMQLPEAEFVAHAREDVPALLAHIAALEAEIARLRAVVKAAREGCDACHKYNGADYCCDCYHAGSGTHDALAALDEEGEA